MTEKLIIRTSGGNEEIPIDSILAVSFNKKKASGSPNEMIFTVRTTAPAQTITLCNIVDGSPDGIIDYGDGSPTEALANGFVSHEYAVASDYDVKITYNTLPTTVRGFFNTGASPLIEVKNMVQTTGLTDFQDVFKNCNLITQVPLFDTASATTVQGMFEGCSSLLALPTFDFSAVNLLASLCSGCSALATLPPLDIPNAANIALAFQNCTSLVNFPDLIAPNATNAFGTFQNCTSLVEFNSIDFSALTTGSNTFSNCPALVQPPPTGTDVRDNDTGTQGTWVKP